MKNKMYFKFNWFDDLQIGDVFKFSPESAFYTVIMKDESNTTFQKTFGKLYTQVFPNDISNKEVMIYPDRKRIIHPR